MNSRRIIILIVAIVVGAVAAFGVTQYVQSVKDEAFAGQELQPAFVVTRPIEKGTSFERVMQEGMIIESSVPVDYRPATAITNPEVELAGLVAITDLAPNSVLVAGNFVAPGVVSTGITDRLAEKEMVTVTVSLDQIKGAAFLIEPGDFVNILMNKSVTEVQEEEVAGIESGEIAPTPENSSAISGLEGTDRSNVYLYDYDARYIYQQAEVLAVGSQLAADLGQTEEEAAAAAAGNRGLITLAVPPEAVQMLLNVGLENLYFSLIPANYGPRPLIPLDADAKTLPGEIDGQLTPYYDIDESVE